FCGAQQNIQMFIFTSEIFCRQSADDVHKICRHIEPLTCFWVDYTFQNLVGKTDFDVFSVIVFQSLCSNHTAVFDDFIDIDECSDCLSSLFQKVVDGTFHSCINVVHT